MVDGSTEYDHRRNTFAIALCLAGTNTEKKEETTVIKILEVLTQDDVVCPEDAECPGFILVAVTKIS